MFRLVHLSDIHISDVCGTIPRLWRGKRLLGGANMLLFRRRHMRNDYFPLIIDQIQKDSVDAVVITGDFSTTALHEEFVKARRTIEPLCSHTKVLTIPGNHDFYTKRAELENRYESYFVDCHGVTHSESKGYPFVQELNDNVVCIGLNSAIPTGLLSSYGRIPEEDLQRLTELLERYSGSFRIVLLHHFLLDKHGGSGLPSRGLQNREPFLEIINKTGAELILHGHEHYAYQYSISSERGDVPVFDPGPATYTSKDPAERGGYQLYEIDEGFIKYAWRFTLDPCTKSFERKSIPIP